MNCLLRPISVVAFSRLYSRCVYTSPWQYKPTQLLLEGRRSLSSVLDFNTKVVNDVIIYQHHNSNFVKLMTVFALVQYTMWTFFSYATYTSLKDAPVSPETKSDPNASWYMKVNLGDPKYRYSISGGCAVIGLITLVSVWGFSIRLVRYLILHKGGAAVSFVTYTPFLTNRIIKIPLHCVSSCQARNQATGYIPIKIKNLKMNFLIDSKGNFRNPLLFDSTVGIKRRM